MSVSKTKNQRDLEWTEQTLRQCADDCLSRPGFKVTVYLRDSDSVEMLKSITDSIQADLDYCSFETSENNTYYKFDNGSLMQFVLMSDITPMEKSNVAVIDSRISIADIDSFVQPVLETYSMSNGAEIASRLDYIQFTSNNEEDN